MRLSDGSLTAGSHLTISLTDPLSFPEDHDVLPGQHANGLNPFQGQHRHLLLNLRFAHFVHRLNRHLRIFGPEFDERDTAAGFERAANALHHFVGKIEFDTHRPLTPGRWHLAEDADP